MNQALHSDDVRKLSSIYRTEFKDNVKKFKLQWTKYTIYPTVLTNACFRRGGSISEDELLDLMNSTPKFRDFGRLSYLEFEYNEKTMIARIKDITLKELDVEGRFLLLATHARKLQKIGFSRHVAISWLFGKLQLPFKVHFNPILMGAFTSLLLQNLEMLTAYTTFNHHHMVSVAYYTCNGFAASPAVEALYKW